MTESGEKTPKPKYEWKNVYIGENPFTGRKYFERRKVPISGPSQSPEEPSKPNFDPKRRGVGNYNADIVSKYLDDKADKERGL